MKDYTNNFTSIAMNYKKHVEWVLSTYMDEDISISKAFQKDIIQNCMGASKNKSKAGWKCFINVVENEKGKFIVVEDEGTVGLTGTNIPQTEITRFTNEGHEFEQSQRLARFSSLYNSSSNQQGAGLYGIGKTMYAIASKDISYYFDSLTEDGRYVANMIKTGQILEYALEEEEAKSFIFDETGISPKFSVGTRVIIPNPTDDLILDIENGNMEKFIQESWWISLQHLKDDAGVYINGKKVPAIDKDCYNYSHRKLFENESYNDCKVKRFEIFVSEDGDIPFEGISYYRKGMKIGPVDVDFKIPEKLKGKLWGYIEFDEKYEIKLIEIENNTHFGVAKNKKRTTTYQNMKVFISERLKKSLIAWKYIKQDRNEDERLSNILSDMAKEVQSLFVSMEFPKLGTGSIKPDYSFRLYDIKFPEEGTIRVTDYDHITFGLKISNNDVVKTKFNYSIAIMSKSNPDRSFWKKDYVEVEGNSTEKTYFDFEVNKNSASDEELNYIVLSIKPSGRGKVQEKKIEFCYNCDKILNVNDAVFINLHSCVFPRKSSKRVNPGEFLSNVAYRVENRQNDTLDYIIKLRLHTTDKEKEQILDFGKYYGRVLPFEENVTEIGELYFDGDVISSFVESGELELRADLIANSGNSIYKKGSRIGRYKSKVNYNCDDKIGDDDSFNPVMVKEPDDHRRSWCEIGSTRTININSAHPAFTALSEDEDSQKDYLREQMLKQYVMIFWKEHRYEAFGLTSDDLDETDPSDLLDIIMDKIEETLFKSMEV